MEIIIQPDSQQASQLAARIVARTVHEKPHAVLGLATVGRRRANAVYFQSHATDEAEQLWFAMDLTPLVRDDKLDVGRFVLGHVDRFRTSVEEKIKKYWVKTR